MHLFNINEQSIFHYLTKSLIQKEIPICFALDYSQAIGDRGNRDMDYIEKAFGANIEKKNYSTVFRNSPQIAAFCASIAASGTLMFRADFSNPYNCIQSAFTEKDEEKSTVPTLHMYSNDEDMRNSLAEHINNLIKDLHCKPQEIAVISFDQSLLSDTGIELLTQLTNKNFALVSNDDSNDTKDFILASPYAVNGLEFQAVILIGVDEGRVPQTSGTSDVSQHYIKYSSYNLLYLTSSRAKYRLVILGNNLNGISSCLEHAIKCEHLVKQDH